MLSKNNQKNLNKNMDKSMTPPILSVAIIGRPNVGKSSLFNVLVGTRKALVKKIPGVTRDIQKELVESWGRYFYVIDTGGYTQSKDVFSPLIKEKVLEVINEVDIILFMMDNKSGLTSEDQEIFNIILKSQKPFLSLVNKVDKVNNECLDVAEFFKLGHDIHPLSVEQRRGITTILEFIDTYLKKRNEKSTSTLSALNKEANLNKINTINVIENINEDDKNTNNNNKNNKNNKNNINLNNKTNKQNNQEQKNKTPIIVVLGKPNAGKSSLINKLSGKDHLLVSKQAGTTTDSIKIKAKIEGSEYQLMDTAGLRSRSKREQKIESLAALKSEKNIKSANVALLVIDIMIGPTKQDAQILDLLLQNHKGVIVVANKCDIAKSNMKEYQRIFREKINIEFKFFPHIEVVFVSALTGLGISKLLKKINVLREKMLFKISTRELNDFFNSVIRKNPCPSYKNRKVKIYYITQTKQEPPSFISYVNFTQGITGEYRRFLVKKIAERWDLKGIPIRIFVFRK